MIHIGKQKQLFVDDFIIEYRDNLKRRMNQPKKFSGNPVIRPDKPWEGRGVGAIAIMYDEKKSLFSCWYGAHGDQTRVCYATSKDGINWEKPKLGIYTFNGSKDNNIILDREKILSSLEPGGYSEVWPGIVRVVKLPESFGSDKRYAAFMFFTPDSYARVPKSYAQINPKDKDGLYMAFSPDGFNWNLTSKKPLLYHSRGIEGKITGDTPDGYYDSKMKLFVLHQKLTTLTRGYGRVDYDNIPDWKRIRAIRTSNDGLEWSAPQLTLLPDDEDTPDTQTYWDSPYEYEGIYIGFLGIYHCRKQTIDAELTLSRDGLNWIRVCRRQPFIPNGEEDSFDSCMIGHVCLVRVGDELRLYYTGSNHRHYEWQDPKYETSIGLATIRPEGFLSLDAMPDGGWLLTKPFTFDGKDLYLNVEASTGAVYPTQQPRGKSLVEVLDEYGEAIAGFGMDECEAITGDHLSKKVGWKRSSISDLRGKPVRLRIYLEDAKLYSFSFA